LVRRICSLVFSIVLSEGTIFFSHNKIANSPFQLIFLEKRAGSHQKWGPVGHFLLISFGPHLPLRERELRVVRPRTPCMVAPPPWSARRQAPCAPLPCLLCGSAPCPVRPPPARSSAALPCSLVCPPLTSHPLDLSPIAIREKSRPEYGHTGKSTRKNGPASTYTYV
jgi:hypothetical protein